MKAFEITDYGYEPDVDRDEDSTLAPFGAITFMLQFVGMAMKLIVFVDEREMWMGDLAEYGFWGDGRDSDFIFDTKKDHEEFFNCLLEKSQEITGRTLAWKVWRNGRDDDDDDTNETIIVPPPPSDSILVLA